MLTNDRFKQIRMQRGYFNAMRGADTPHEVRAVREVADMYVEDVTDLLYHIEDQQGRIGALMKERDDALRDLAEAQANNSTATDIITALARSQISAIHTSPLMPEYIVTMPNPGHWVLAAREWLQASTDREATTAAAADVALSVDDAPSDNGVHGMEHAVGDAADDVERPEGE